MKFLVTGSGGQLGREWVEFLETRNELFAAFQSGELDVTNAPMVFEILNKEKPLIVINCAAYTGVDKAETESTRAFLVNETGVKNLADGCKKIGALLVHYSTDYVFSGDREDRQVYPGGYPEDAVCKPINEYGRSKHAGEVALRQSGADFLLLRVSWLCGRYSSNFVKTMLRLGNSRDVVSVVEDQYGSPTFTTDVVKKSAALIEKKERGIFHLSSTGLISWADFAEEIFRLAKAKTVVKRIPSEEYPVEAKRPSFSLLSTKKVEKRGLKPIDWEAGLRDLMQQTGLNQID